MKLVLLGDIAFLGRCSSVGNTDIEEYFSEATDYLKTVDYVVGNLETPFSKMKKTHGAKSAYICSNPEDVKLLKQLNVNAVSLANNHIYDYGDEGASLTMRLLTQEGINYFGVDGTDHKIEIDGNKLAFSGFCCYSTNPQRAVPYGQKGVNEFNVQKASEILKYNSGMGYLNIFAVHAGIEHINYPSIDSINIARRFADICPFIYYGHHPHVIQGIENYKKSLIAYSLGNFCFDDVYTSISKEPLVKLSDNNRSSVIIEIEIQNNQVQSYRTIPIFIGTDKMHVGTKGINDIQLQEYSSALSLLSEKSYNEMRKKRIDAYFGKRKSQRNLMWFIKRMRPRYAKLLLSNRMNKIKYVKCVKQHIN